MWPPLVTDEQLIRKRPPRAPYLSTPPAVIAIDVGRQLFVDGYLVEWTNATRTFHRAISRGVVLEPTADERIMQNRKFASASLGFHHVATARPFSGGAWYDDCTRRFILHYRCRYEYPGMGMGCVAFSRDGVHWRRPNTTLRQELRPNRGCKNCPTVRDPPNRIECATLTESFTTWLDHTEADQQKRWKAMSRSTRSIAPLTLWNSPDGVHWSRLPQAKVGVATDRASFFYNPFRRVWVYSLRENLCRGGHGHLRISRYKEVSSLDQSDWPHWVQSYFQCGHVKPSALPQRWIGVDEWDCEGRDVEQCDLYHLDASPYESLLVGQFAVLYPGFAHGGCKSSFTHVGFSRDGFHWSRPDASEFAPRRPIVDDPLHLRYQQPIAGNWLVVGDLLYLYYGGATRCQRCNANPEGWVGKGGSNASTVSTAFCDQGDHARDGVVTPQNSSMKEVTALAVLRRDGFASLSPPEGHDEAHVLTHPLIFTHRQRYLFVNVDAAHGELLVSVEPIPPDELPDVLPGAPPHSMLSYNLRHLNRTQVMVRWRDAPADALGALSAKAPSGAKPRGGRRVSLRFRLRFVLRGAATRLYAFWVSAHADGRSSGFIQGPGFVRGVDRNASAHCTA